MAIDPILKKTIELPYNYTFTVQATPWTIRRTFFKLLPWALVVMLPAGRRSRVASLLATRISPLFKQNFR